MDTVTPESVGTPLRDRREAVDLTRQQIAHEADCSVSAVGFFEAGFKPANSPTLRRIFDVLEQHEAAKAVPLTREGPAGNGTSVETATIAPAEGDHVVPQV